MEDLEAPQKAIWQVWMQGSLMGSDIWDALPGQNGDCSNEGNQKRQEGGVCSLPVSTTASATTEDSASSTSGSTVTSESGPVSITATPTGVTSESVTADFPTLTRSATISTPAGSSCVSTTSVSSCLGVGNRDPVCVDVPVCASFVATATSTSSETEEPEPTPTGEVYINIYEDDGCIVVREKIILNALGDAYGPDEQFGCFSVTYLSEAAINSGALSVSESLGCFVPDSTDEDAYREYPDLLEIQYEYQTPFTMGCLNLVSKPE